ncbi:MAG TPA: DUF1697 domain-containing protein [Rhizomicrobium sp.]|jgi:uncharacterized protein (DUF1697 family)
MTICIALLRAVNVGGTGKLPMAKLKTLCRDIGFTQVQTYIASGNVVFETSLSETKAKAALERGLLAHVGKPVGVVLRSAAGMSDVLKANPFPKAPPNLTVAIFLDKAPPADALKHAIGVSSEEMRRGKREIYVHYPDGQGRSKLRIPAAKSGTARNMNTIAKLVEMASARRL